MKIDFKRKCFSEIASIYNGNSISKKDKEELYTDISNGTPYVATKDVLLDHSIIYDNGISIPVDKKCNFKIAPPQSVLICSEGGSAGKKVAHTDCETHFGNKLFAIVPNEGVLSKYIFYFTLSSEFKRSFNALMTGVIGGVSLKKFKSISIPIPTIEEQKFIVSSLEGSINNINELNANNINMLESIDELYNSYLAETFLLENTKKKNWEVLKLKDVCEKITDGVHKKPVYTDSGVPFIKINNLTAGPGISFEKLSYISEDDHKEFCKRTNPEKGDILITKDGTIGVVRIIETDIEFSIFVSLALLKPKDKSMSKYLQFILESPLIQDQIKPKGAALKHIYLKDLREYMVPIAPKNERSKIVERLSYLSEKIELARKVSQDKGLAIKELKQSILQKAFNGELA